MSDEQPTESGRRRTRGTPASARKDALERLKAIRRGNRREMDDGGFQVKMEQPIYDTVDDDEYEVLVAKRREEVKGFIIDDDGLGYGDEGQEEDWSIAGATLSSEESEGESEKPKKKSKNSNSKKKEKESVKKPSALASAAALMGKQRISSMFTSSVFKKDIQKNVSCDSIVDDVIAEFAPDESDRERRRRTNSSNLAFNNSNKIQSPALRVSPVKIEKPVVGSLNLDAENAINGSDEKCETWKDCSEQGENYKSEDNDWHISERGANSEDMMRDEEMKESSEASEHENKECLLNKSEVKEVEKKVFSLNAKTDEVKDPALSATAGWQAVRTAGIDDCNGSGPKGNQTTSSEEKLDFEVESEGSLPFYMLEAHEEMYGANGGNVYLFGKVKSGAAYHSCCVVVKNMQRCLYAIPTMSFLHNDTIIELEKKVEEVQNALMAFKDTIAKQGRDSVKSQMSSIHLKDTISKLEKDVEESQTALRTRLHELASDLKTEMTKELLERNVSTFSMTPVKRNYAFERSDVPHGENYVLKISYPFKDPPLPLDLIGNHFRAFALELFLIKRKIKGPSWLSISKFSSCPASQRVSWCKFEVTVGLPKDIQVSTSSKHISEIPPVVVTTINLKTIINEKQNVNEIVSASVVCCHRAKIDIPTVTSDWTRPGMLSHFTVVRKLEGGIFPMGFTKEAVEKNAKAGSNVVCYESSERALLNRLMIELHKLDSDVLVGHNISGFDLDVLLHRVQACRVPSSMWSKIGRLKRSTMPKLNKGSSVFGSGASPGIMSCIAGRLLCDTLICSRDLLKEVSYSLTQLAKTQLNKDRKEITPQDIHNMFQRSESLMELIEYGETDAWLSMELMFHLSVLPLTRQLTNISGNLWHKTLQGARAQRVEYLLLHAFHAKKFIVPDKFSSQSKDTRTTKRKTSTGVESNEIDPDDTICDNELPENHHGKTKKGPSYSGGLVLEPKKGLYDKYTLLLDFNSLYPSIIQEYNICFTTVERSGDGPVPHLPSSKRTGVLPELLKNLVERRRMVKTWLKTASGLKVQQFDIQQQALKLTANSMYGCLGFSNSRFYAKPLAELITLQGREILQSTVNLVENTLNLEVIYGDTDSIMIYSGLDDIGKAKSIAGKVIQEVNKKYRCLEIDLDGLYKRMLLLKKKKYAAVKLQFKDGKPYEVIERKGLDMVRRDWSLLSKEIGEFCLSQILSGGSCEDAVEAIHNSLMKVQEEMRNGQIPLEKYVITKTLTKPPEAYPDARNQPHVEVACRLKRSGYVTGCSAGDTVPYIICCEQVYLISNFILQLNKDRKEITPQDIHNMFQRSESLMELIEYGETDAWLSMELMFHLSVLPLTRQLTNISGNLWHKTLQGARAQRVEYLLLHAFHAKKFIVPDKFSSQSKDTRTTKRKTSTGVESNEIDPDDTICDNELPENHHGKTKKGPSYSGGLVLEPKKGLYDKYTLLLDFNSLYPSIIQEYNICFTTVERSGDGPVPHLPSSKRTGVLPELLKNLVERRRMVKTWLKTASGLKVQQFDIQQQALKLTANSMYGCLGFSNSRFYAKPLAELITLQGREILQSTVNLVENTLNLEVIYGDTDSIMIYSGLDDIGKAKSIAGKVIQEVNKKYRCLEIDLDGLYKRMLLLKKKKYAAVKLQFKDGKPYEVIERKGLDMVRRDWSLLSKEIGEFCLSQILSGGSCEDAVEAIHNSLMKVQEEMRNGQIPLEKYVITKTLTKPPEAYPDARNQPHVEVACRLKRSGYVTGCSAGDTVPYIICCEQGKGSTSSVGIAQRARHPDELKKDNESWIIDIDYYLAQQIHPMISRLCASIQGTSPARLADCLGLDPSKFQNKSIESVSNDPSNLLSLALHDEERYRGCEPLVLTCPSCSGTFECSPILNSVCTLINTKPEDMQAGSTNDFWHKLRCPKCPDEGDKGIISPATIANQVKTQAERFLSKYFNGVMMCGDETCNYSTRGVNLRALGDSERGTTCPNYPRCNGHLIRKYTEAHLYRQLFYFCYTLDTVRCIEKIEGEKRVMVEKEVGRIRRLVETAASTVQKIRDRCAYGWVQLNDLVVVV